MNRQMLIDLLSAHADSLNRSENVDEFDSKAWLLARYPGGGGQILRLLQLAQVLKQALVPMSTSHQFRSDLGRRLTQAPQIALAKGRRPIRWIILIVAAVVGLLLYVLRRLQLGQSQSQALTTAA